MTAFRDGQVTLRTNRRVDGFTEALKELGYQGIRNGDLVIHGMDAFAGAIGVSDSDGKASPVVHAYAMRDADARFVAHALRVAARLGYVQSLAKGIRERSTAFDAQTFKTLLLPTPPLAEQRAIADYLDRETAKIDALIAKQNEMIATLRERRRAVVRGAVLDEQADDLCETGCWFGRVPRHWGAPRLSYHHHVMLGRMINASSITDEDVAVPYLAAGSIQPDALVLNDEKTLTVAPSDLSKYALRRGDVVVVEGGAGYGRSHWLQSDLNGWAFQNHVVRVRARSENVDSRYTRLVIEVCRLSGFFEANNRTATMPSLSSDVLGALRVPMPPLDEQREIADYLDRETAKIDTLIAKVERHIELAKERRSALITAAVTGQIDVTKDAA